MGARVLSSDPETAAFRSGVRSEVVVATVQDMLNLNISVQQLQLQKDRITIEINAQSSVIKQDFPPDDCSRLSQVAIEAIHCTRSLGVVTAHGYNLEIAFDQTKHPSSFYQIASLMFNRCSLPDGCSFRGGRAFISFHDEDNRIWNVTLESRFRQENTPRLFFSLNFHNAGPVASPEIESQFTRSIDMSDRFIARLFG